MKDALMLLSDAQALTATAVSTNTIDLGNTTPKRDIAVGEPMELSCSVDVAADATTGDETYEFQFVSDDDAALGSPTVLCQVLIPRALLVAGYQFSVPIPQNRILERYVGARFVLGGTTPTITVTVFLQPRSMSSVKPIHYADAITVS